ncbi:polyphenol oxidase [Pseudarcicella hirudinis]|uniref:Polyphenol oxidase n=1 Tax=Pseudarcicella hirudinis TaxID=1079859 RepID=A0A1I5Y7A8_9BACT|nr:tyrosinase family protein [Pseudarcicella hirudinis]SFQ40106.1 polyphenol oxidase [Pseudarcicella hirudinis]
MKRTITLLGSILLACTVLFSTVGLKNKNLVPGENEIKLCYSSTSTVAEKAMPFETSVDKVAAVMIRKNIYSLSDAEINSIKAGIAAMKALPITNQTSWQYQAAIHGTFTTPNSPAWNSCQHGTQFFLSWHRMYLYFFERILRAKSGNPNLTLPYWDYQTNAALHPAYRNSSTGNTLYDNTRNSSINGGGSLPSSIMVAIDNALNNNIPFFNFNSDLEGPHGSVHVSIGGNMGVVKTAAKDPVFWLHHANIDRLWEKWLRKCGGRTNPTSDNAWMNTKFTFFDENGHAVIMTGSQIVNTATQLNYRYDFPPKLPCNFSLDISKWNWKILKPLRVVNTKPFDKSRLKLSFAKTPVINDDFKLLNSQKLNFSTTGISDKVMIEIDQVKVSKLPEGTIEVYLNLPANETPSVKSKSFAGVLNLFGIGEHDHHGKETPISVNVSSAVKNLGLGASDLSKAELTFIVRGNTLNGKEIKTEDNIQIGAVNFVIHKAQAQ